VTPNEVGVPVSVGMILALAKPHKASVKNTAAALIFIIICSCSSFLAPAPMREHMAD
jgi:hypothetical protein